MPENVENWWRRRQVSKGTGIPYRLGTYRADWASFPVLIRQYHPDLNGFVTLTQIPPAADVYLLWQCDSGHRFVATPSEQRERPGRSRRRSAWCPECTEQAVKREHRRPTTRRVVPAASAPVSARQAHRSTESAMTPGSAFYSPNAPRPASAAEARLRAGIADRLDIDLTVNAVRVRRPFHDRLEVWPDIVIAELMLAIEYDTTGRTSTEHVGQRERSDRWKDRLLRETGWEIVRIRTSKLSVLGPFDLAASGVTEVLIDRILDRAREIRGDLIVAAYERRRVEREDVVPDVGLEPTRP